MLSYAPRRRILNDQISTDYSRQIFTSFCDKNTRLGRAEANHLSAFHWTFGRKVSYGTRLAYPAFVRHTRELYAK